MIDLSLTDFELFDTGGPRAIAELRSEPAPISIAVVFDVSGNTDVSQSLPAAREAVERLVSLLEPDRDQSAIFAFDTRLVALQAFTTSPADVIARLDQLRPVDSTSLCDGVAQAGRELVARGARRRAVVVVTDGADIGRRLTPADVYGLASSIDMPVYVLAVTSPHDHLAKPLHQLAQWTGGALFVAGAPGLASVAAHEIVTELRHRYLLAFEPSARAGWHPLTILTSDSDLVVLARSGYVARPRPRNQD